MYTPRLNGRGALPFKHTPFADPGKTGLLEGVTLFPLQGAGVRSLHWLSEACEGLGPQETLSMNGKGDLRNQSVFPYGISRRFRDMRGDRMQYFLAFEGCTSEGLQMRKGVRRNVIGGVLNTEKLLMSNTDRSQVFF